MGAGKCARYGPKLTYCYSFLDEKQDILSEIGDSADREVLQTAQGAQGLGW